MVWPSGSVLHTPAFWGFILTSMSRETHRGANPSLSRQLPTSFSSAMLKFTATFSASARLRSVCS